MKRRYEMKIEIDVRGLEVDNELPHFVRTTVAFATWHERTGRQSTAF